MSRLFFIIFFTSTLLLRSQTDTIFKNDGKIVICSITLINQNNIFYNTKKVDGNYIALDVVKSYSQNGKRHIPSSPQIAQVNSKLKDSLIVPIAMDSTYAIVHVSTPELKREFIIKIFYGNGKIEDFKTIEFNLLNNYKLINEITNALNYMAKKGYALKQTIVEPHKLNPFFQYIFERK